MKNLKIAVVVLVLLILAGGYFAWQQWSRLSEEISGLSGRVEDLTARLAEYENRAKEAEDRAAEAESKADRAEKAADEAERKAAAATAHAEESAVQAQEAKTAREEAERLQQEATEARLAAEQARKEAEEERAFAERQQAAAEERSVESAKEAEEARLEARRAQAEADKVRQRMEQELDRMQRALGRIADTRRTALGLVMTLDASKIEFDFDKSDLRLENREVLSRIAGVLLTFEDYSVQIFGHTDDVGSVEYNQTLSEKRAEAVREYLAEAGVDPDVMTTKGFGKSSPLVEGTDPESRQRNRRVELAIVFSEGEYEGIHQEEDTEG